MARLGDICEVLNGYAFKSEKYTSSGVRIIRIANVQKGYIEDTAPAFYPIDTTDIEKYTLYEDDLLISLTGNVGRVALLKKEFLPAALNQRVACLRLKDSAQYDKSFLYCFLNSDYFENKCIQSAKGVAQKNMSIEWLKEYQIPNLSLVEQKEIAAVLNKISELISARTMQLSKMNMFVKSRFIELFGDLKTNPKGWSVLPFPAFAAIDGNMTTDYEKYADYPHIGIDSIEKGTGELKGYRTVREDGVISGKYIFTPQHIIYSKIRPNLNKVALPTFEGLCSADAYPILPNRENCNRVFLAVAMRSEYYLEYILQFSSRTNLPKVNRKEIMGFRMPLPPLSLQEQFAAFVEQVDKSKLAIQQSLEKLETLKKALMQQYFG